MKKFRFRLQAVLELREREKKHEEEVFQRHLGLLAAEEAELRRLQEEEAHGRRDLAAAQQEPSLDLQTLMIFGDYLQNLDQLMTIQKERIAAARERLEAQRLVLVEAHRAHEVIQTLRDRDEAAWLVALEKAEAAMLDELAMGQHARKPPRA